MGSPCEPGSNIAHSFRYLVLCPSVANTKMCLFMYSQLRLDLTHLAHCGCPRSHFDSQLRFFENSGLIWTYRYPSLFALLARTRATRYSDHAAIEKAIRVYCALYNSKVGAQTGYSDVMTREAFSGALEDGRTSVDRRWLMLSEALKALACMALGLSFD